MKNLRNLSFVANYTGPDSSNQGIYLQGAFLVEFFIIYY